MSLFGRKKQSLEREQAADYPVISGMHYMDVLAGIEDRIRPEWYLEIGSRTGASLLPRKCGFVAVDPVFQLKSAAFASQGNMHFFRMTSDDFFAANHLESLRITPGLAFIDGMHQFEFALRDFMNCERSMSPDGIICLHDVCPFNGDMTTRDDTYLARGSAWTGDIWKIVHVLQKYRPDLSISVLPAKRMGLCCVRNLDPGNTALSRNYDQILADYTPLDLAKLGHAHHYAAFQFTQAEDFLALL
jgi:Methyltransferase domain